MSAGAVVFMVFAIAVLWGGLAVCLRIAIKIKINRIISCQILSGSFFYLIFETVFFI